MTYRRADGSFAAAMTASLALGQEWLAERLGLSTSRLRQCANPMRRDSLPLHLAAECDVICAAAGRGTPLFDAYRRRLVEAGVLRESDLRVERRTNRLVSACRAAAALLLAAVDGEDGRVAA